MEMIYINEMFRSHQGTGRCAGQLQFFVRFQGCSVKCPIRHICDEPQSLPEPHTRTQDAFSVDQIVQEAIKSVGTGGWIHITGGEPLQNLSGWKTLVRESFKAGLRVQTQTSGLIDHCLPIGRSGMITVSPKTTVDKLKLKTGSELVLVAAPWVSTSIARNLFSGTTFSDYYIAPAFLGNNEWSNKIALDLINDLFEEGQPEWKLTHQIHKIFGAK